WNSVASRAPIGLKPCHVDRLANRGPVAGADPATEPEPIAEPDPEPRAESSLSNGNRDGSAWLVPVRVFVKNRERMSMAGVARQGDSRYVAVARRVHDPGAVHAAASIGPSRSIQLSLLGKS